MSVGLPLLCKRSLHHNMWRFAYTMKQCSHKKHMWTMVYPSNSLLHTALPAWLTTSWCFSHSSSQMRGESLVAMVMAWQHKIWILQNATFRLYEITKLWRCLVHVHTYSDNTVELSNTDPLGTKIMSCWDSVKCPDYPGCLLEKYIHRQLCISV